MFWVGLLYSIKMLGYLKKWLYCWGNELHPKFLGSTVRLCSLHAVYKVVLPFLSFSGVCPRSHLPLNIHLCDLYQSLMPLKDTSGLRGWPMFSFCVLPALSGNYELSVIQSYLYLTWLLFLNISIICRRLNLRVIQSTIPRMFVHLFWSHLKFSLETC